MKTFTPIAMKCTQEQFEAIKPKLKHLKIFMFNKEWNSFYLSLFEDGSITNGLTCSSSREIHEEWNEEIFLRSCGIETETLQPMICTQEEAEAPKLVNIKRFMVDLMGYSVLVDNEEQARKLQEIAFEQGFEWVSHMGREIRHLDREVFQFGIGGEKVITYSLNKKHYQNKFITKKAHFNDLFKEETLQEKEQRLLKELEEVRKEIEENKIKVGDWVKHNNNIVFKVEENKYDLGVLNESKEFKKITDPQLIELLENEIK